MELVLSLQFSQNVQHVCFQESEKFRLENLVDFIVGILGEFESVNYVNAFFWNYHWRWLSVFVWTETAHDCRWFASTSVVKEIIIIIDSFVVAAWNWGWEKHFCPEYRSACSEYHLGSGLKKEKAESDENGVLGKILNRGSVLSSSL